MQKRNQFNLGSYNLMTGKMGVLYPIQVKEALPGDTFKGSTRFVARMAPMLAPIMHPIRLHISHWFVPNRLLWDDFETFATGGLSGEEFPAIPQIALSAGSQVGTLFDYMGCAGENTKAVNVQAMPIRAYNKIWNEFFRDKDIQTESAISYESGADTITDTSLKYVRWNPDDFTRSKPWVQRGTNVTVPIATDPSASQQTLYYGYKTTANQNASITYIDNATHFDSKTLKSYTVSVDVANQTVTVVYSNVNQHGKMGVFVGVGTLTAVFNLSGKVSQLPNQSSPVASSYNVSYSGGNIGIDNTLTLNAGSVLGGYSDMVSNAGYLDIRDLRYASSVQRLKEARAKWEGEYKKMLQSMGLKHLDARLDYPEYLGGGNHLFQISEVLQTSPTDNSYVGDMYGHGIGSGKSRTFKYFVPEHGWIISLAYVLPDNLYVDGIDRFWLKDSREDIYIKELANIGMQEIYGGEIYPSDNAKDVFGYQERYNEYRHSFSRVHGLFRTTLSDWHLGRMFDSAPALNENFVSTKSSNFSRIFAEQTQDHLYIMFYHSLLAKRCMSKRAHSYLE